MRALHIAAALGIGAALQLMNPAQAAGEKRIALVVGNGDYASASKLNNPVNDAKAIAGMLQSAGFDRVELHENLGIRELRQAVKEFSDLARDADTAVVYYSGHGIEVNGVNYLVPTDAALDRDIDVPYEAFSLENLVQVLEPARRLRLVMLDACRDNPFSRSMKRTIGSRAVGRGLAPVEPASVNTLIGFAAKAGSIALDGEGANSPYALALLNNLPVAGLDLRIAFGRVRDDVLKATRNRQEPFVYGSLGGTNISIVDVPAATAAEPQPKPPAQSVLDRAAQVWAVTKDSTSIAVLEDFIRHFGPTIYGSMARARLEELKKAKVAVVSVPKQPPTGASAADLAANAWAATQGTTSIAVLEDFIRQFGKTPYGSMARARLTELKKSKVAAVPQKSVDQPPAPSKEQCPNITGTWNSWASGLFGKSDATFYKNGTCVHRSGIKGKWWCEGGQLRMAWGGENPKTFRLSPDGKKIIHIADGAVGFSRD